MRKQIVHSLLPVAFLLLGFVSTTSAWAGEPGGRLLRHLSRYRQDSNERSHSAVMQAFRDVVGEAHLSTVRVLCDDVQTSLGTVVSADGYVLTKASDLVGAIECVLNDGSRVQALIVATDRDYDLALLKLDAKPLVPVSWSQSSPLVGSWLATSGLGSDPMGIGVMSAATRPIPAPKAALGVRLETDDAGPRVGHVVDDSAADKAGLLVDDIILRVNGVEMKDTLSLVRTISEHRPGERIRLMIQRNGSRSSLTVTLGSHAQLHENDQTAIMDSLGGPLSDRRNGFPLAIQHDTVLRPRDCGGPLVDLEGKVVGINIARASRVATFAIPAESIRELLPRMRAQGLVQGAGAESLQNTSTLP